MACWKGAETYEEIGGSNDSDSDSGPSAQPRVADNKRIIKSGPPVWKPPKHVRFAQTEKERRRKERIRELTHSCPSSSYYVGEIPIDEAWLMRMRPPTNCWIRFKKYCSGTYSKIKNSRFIYIWQFLIALLCLTTIIMGSVFFQSCEGSYALADPILNLLMGVSGLMFVYKWLVKVRRQRKDEFYFNSEKHTLVRWLVVTLIFTGIGYYFFTQTSPKTVQSTAKAQCTNIYYDYMYCMYIANAAFLALGIFFYLPDCCIYAWIWGHLRYQRLDFPSATLNYRNTGFLNHEFDFDADFEG